MSEHSEHYHDADRNKPLPGAPVSSKEEVLQTLLDAARGEITALTEANKLLAAQVAGDAVILADALNTVLWLERRLPKGYGEVPHVQRTKASLRAAIESSFDSRTAKVSARAADAPSEPSEIVLRLRNIVAEDVTPYFCVNVPKDLLRSAADALDSQPTEMRPTDDELWDATLRDRDAYHEWADKLADAIAAHCGVDIGEHSNQNLPWAEALEAIESADCIEDRSQPTDGEVRNG